MALYQIHISYDGAGFHGYQRQLDQRTIQGEIEFALKKVGWSGGSILSSGRTDTGVHAEEQVAVFKLDWAHSTSALRNAVNAHLPPEIAIVEVKKQVNGEFHPRYDAKSRIYRYQVYASAIRKPLLEKYHWRVWPEPDIDLMNEGAALLVGSHEFKKFGKPYEPEGRTERRIKNVEWKQDSAQKSFVFRIEANSFLYHMVRRIVFVLVRVGQCKTNAEDVAHALAGYDNLLPGIAPAKGLFLEKIIY